MSFSPWGNGYYLFPSFSLYFPSLRLPFPLFFPSSFFLLLFTPFVSLAVSRDIYTLALFNWRSRRSFARDHCQLRIETHAVCQMAFIRDKINIYSVSSLPLLFYFSHYISPLPFLSALFFCSPEFTLLTFILFSLYRHASVCLSWIHELNINLYLSQLNIKFYFYPLFLVRTCTFYIHLNLILIFEVKFFNSN